MRRFIVPMVLPALVVIVLTVFLGIVGFACGRGAFSGRESPSGLLPPVLPDPPTVVKLDTVYVPQPVTAPNSLTNCVFLEVGGVVCKEGWSPSWDER